ncbi:hypothetical protein QBC43DRAFT_263623 [Cladorrhinum sp. PSN259]|nr:hypothetical protein QBC43DRAFT_263623 [Cladorrhinum sp. PSN259]
MAEQRAPLPRVAIIGAGVTGLLLAHGLQKNGFPVTVYDKEAYVGERVREWTMIVHWALSLIHDILPDDILADVNTAYTDPISPESSEPIPFYNGTTGEVAFHVGGRARRLSRNRFRRLCTRGLNVQWAKAVEDVSVPDSTSQGPVTIHFSDGTTALADLVIGADGPNSYVRRWLLGEEAAKPVASPIACSNGLVRYPNVELAERIRAAHPICMVASAPEMCTVTAIQEIPSPTDPSTWQFHVFALWNEPEIQYLTGDEAITKTKECVGKAELAEPFRSVFAEIPSDGSKSNVFVSQLHYWVTRPWDGKGGRVTLAGDAAHALLPARGQGLNHALKDVEVLLAEFSKVQKGATTVQEALDMYEEEVFARGPMAVRGSLEDAKDLMRVEGLEEGRTATKGFAQVQEN